MTARGPLVSRLCACAAILGVLVLAACASLSEDQCLAGDWTGIGYADGANGRGPDYIERHQKACAKVGVTPDVTAWLAGRSQGLALYCTPAKAYTEASRGRSIAPYCSPAQFARMRPAIERGEIYYDLGQDIAYLRDDLYEIERLMLLLEPGYAARYAWFANERFRIQRRIFTLENRQLRYAGWPG